MDSRPIADEELVAYLDGELPQEQAEAVQQALRDDPALRARLDALRIDTDAVKSAFDNLLPLAPGRAQPTLEERPPGPPDRSPGRPLGRPLGRSLGRPLGRRAAIAATLVAVAAIGFAGGRITAPTQTEDWRMAVAEYQLLYRSETLTHLDPSPAELETERARVVARLGLDIAGATLRNVSGLRYRRAQILGYEAAPLAQFAFLDSRDRPVAFCVTPTEAGDRPLQTQTLRGLAAVSWAADGFAFLVIGDVPQGLLDRAARDLSASLARASRTTTS
ncbi:anti-sigma factor family protein [Pelagibius sp.]